MLNCVRFVHQIHNRRSLDVCIPLGSLQNPREVAAAETKGSALLGAAKVRLVEASGGSGLDLSLPDPMHLETSGFLAVLQAVLESRRKDCHRPEDLDKMSSTEARLHHFSPLKILARCK